MKVVRAGHVYDLDQIIPHGAKDSNVGANQRLTFVCKEGTNIGTGVTSQEVLRALIDRSIYVNMQLSHPDNKRILHHLRMALVLHECRALERDVEKGSLNPESIPIHPDGHFAFAPEK